MNEKRDIENLLMRLRAVPSAGVKRAVLARYAERFGRGRAAAGPLSFLRRPVPLYIAAAFVVLAAGLSFIGAQKLSRPQRTADSSSIAMQDSVIGAALRRSLQVAPPDVF